MLTQSQKEQCAENFFVASSAVNEYTQTQAAIDEAVKPPKKKVYKSMSKLLKECCFVGSLIYGNNFIA